MSSNEQDPPVSKQVSQDFSSSQRTDSIRPLTVEDRTGRSRLTQEEKKKLELEKLDWVRTLSMDDVKFNDDVTDIVDIAGKPVKDSFGKMLVLPS